MNDSILMFQGDKKGLPGIRPSTAPMTRSPSGSMATHAFNAPPRQSAGPQAQFGSASTSMGSSRGPVFSGPQATSIMQLPQSRSEFEEASKNKSTVMISNSVSRFYCVSLLVKCE